MNKNPKIISKILKIINHKTNKFKQIPNIDITLSETYHQKINDIQEWLSLTQWSHEPLMEEMLNKVQNQLLELGLIDKKSTFAKIVKVI